MLLESGIHVLIRFIFGRIFKESKSGPKIGRIANPSIYAW